MSALRPTLRRLWAAKPAPPPAALSLRAARSAHAGGHGRDGSHRSPSAGWPPLARVAARIARPCRSGTGSARGGSAALTIHRAQLNGSSRRARWMQDVRTYSQTRLRHARGYVRSCPAGHARSASTRLRRVGPAALGPCRVSGKGRNRIARSPEPGRCKQAQLPRHRSISCETSFARCFAAPIPRPAASPPTEKPRPRRLPPTLKPLPSR